MRCDAVRRARRADLMRVLITGATGTIGLALADALRARGDQVVALSRDPERGQRVLGDGAEVHAWARADRGAAAGRGAGRRRRGRPSARRAGRPALDAMRPRRKIRDSRVLATRQLVTGLKALPDAERPAGARLAVGHRLLRTAGRGAAGRAGCRRATIFSPRSSWPGSGRPRPPPARCGWPARGPAWCSRPSGGALAKMLPFFKLGVGGPVAGGHQYVPWIHLEDVVGALLCCVDEAAPRVR